MRVYKCGAAPICWRRAYTEYLKEVGYKEPPPRAKIFLAGFVSPEMVENLKKGIYMETIPSPEDVSTWCPDFRETWFENQCAEWKKWAARRKNYERVKFQNQRARTNIPFEIRHEVAVNAHFKCVYCDAAHNSIDDEGKKVKCVVDHFIPLALGGTSDISNLVFACSKCNREKGVEIWQRGQKLKKIS